MISKENLLTLMNEMNENKLELLCSTYNIHKNLIEIMKMLEIKREDLALNEYDEESLYDLISKNSKVYTNFIELEYFKKMKSLNYTFNYSKDHVRVLSNSLDHGFDISHLDPDKYDWYQMKQIYLSLKNKSNVSHLDPEKYDWCQMSEIRLGLEHKVDISHLDPEKYDWCKMEQIRLGLESYIDISHLDPEKYEAQQMEEIRLELESKLK